MLTNTSPSSHRTTPVIQMAEDKESLSLLGLCFPPSVHPSLHFSLNQIQSVAEAASKYEITAISTELLALCLRDCNELAVGIRVDARWAMAMIHGQFHVISLRCL